MDRSETIAERADMKTIAKEVGMRRVADAARRRTTACLPTKRRS